MLQRDQDPGGGHPSGGVRAGAQAELQTRHQAGAQAGLRPGNDNHHKQNDKTLRNTLQIINVWVTFLVLGDNFGGKQDECLETDKFGQTAYSLFRHGREFQQQQQAIWIL